MSAVAHGIEIDTGVLDLAALRTMTFVELDELYRAGKRPNSIADLNGDAIGAMLAWRTPASGPIAWLLRAWGGGSLFPWEGKSFKSHSDEDGEGINRVSMLGKRRWFPFKTRFEPSFLDGKPAFRLDYSGPANPPFIRSIVDEVREVAPRLYLGPAALLVGGKPKPILYFAVSLQ
ncbi:MAG TPA: hypothetical protein VN643_06170 [Pyrinomonadaceae bacterium]|nr:hypothetical protein [Pyrinomonadaceae bacterium]